MRGAAARLFALLACLALALDALSLGLSQTVARVSPALALRLRPGSAAASTTGAEQRLAAQDPTGAHRLALQALARDPANVVGLRVLGLSLEAQGRETAAEQVMRLAGRLSWRDGTTQAWLLQNSLLAGNASDAVLRADSLLRRTEDSDSSPVTGILTAGAQFLPGLRGPLAQRLALDPPWRTRFLIRLGSTPGVEEGARQVLTMLRRGSSPPTAQETAPLINQLVGHRQFIQAHADWEDLSPASRSSGRGSLRDGQFREASDGTPFTWTLQDGVGASQDRTPAPDLVSGMMALSVTYDGYATPDLARQLLVLPPGPRVLSWRERLEEGDGRLLNWRVSCAPSGPVLATSAAQTGPAGLWRTRQVAFTVPASGCEGQWLQLIPSSGDRHSSNTMLFTDFSL